MKIQGPETVMPRTKECEARIGLIDPYVNGHHAGYARAVADALVQQGYRVAICAPEPIQMSVQTLGVDCLAVKDLSNVHGLVRHWLAYRMYVRSLNRLLAWGASHVCFLYADRNLLAIDLATRAAGWCGHGILIVHWASGVGAPAVAGGKSNWKSIFHRAPARRLAKSGFHFIIHDPSLEVVLEGAIRKANTSVVPYPVFPLPDVTAESASELRASLGLTFRDRLVLCFGATRYDKGVDLAVDALHLLPAEVHLLVAGKALDFGEAEIRRRASQHGVEPRVHCINRYLTETEASRCFRAADLVLLPYRLGFSGQSGPLTLAASVGKPVVAADIPVLSSTVRNYSLGGVFRPNDVNDLARTIVRTLERPTVLQREQFNRDHGPHAFREALIRAIDKCAETV